MHPHLPLHGHLDEPATLAPLRARPRDGARLSFPRDTKDENIYASVELLALQEMDLARAQPDLTLYFPQFANARGSGVFGLVDVPASLPNPVTLRLYVELNEGGLQTCAPRHFHVFTADEEKSPYPPHPPERFQRAHEALRTALTRLAEDVARRSPQAGTAPSVLRPAPVATHAPPPKHVLLVTHNLNLEGTPLFLVDYARYLTAAGVRLTVAQSRGRTFAGEPHGVRCRGSTRGCLRGVRGQEF